jgi:DNA-binding SARP family transcriptional activator/tetratricopeptide (TPR) repeat protein
MAVMPTEMEFGLLGPLVVRSGGSELPVRRRSQAALLAALLLEGGRVISTDAISDVLWGDSPPESALEMIRHHVWQLRQTLGQTGQERIVTRPGGYLLHVEHGELDLSRFEELLGGARVTASDGSWEVAAARSRDALALWRGEPLAGIESETLLLREAPRLAELRLQAGEILAEAELHLGGHAPAAAELARLAAANPLREHVHALLMLALYRCGRQADALTAYQNIRQSLVGELGAEPGSELQHLHQQILAADPALDLPRDAVGPDQPARLPADVPRQLPAAVTQFTGRATELTTLTQIAARPNNGDVPGTVVISAIGGTAGVGKTALALRFAHQAASRFPDGQLYASLRGFDPGGTPTDPGEAIRAFLDALHVPADRIPASLEARAGLYRSLVADRQMLIVLDNARDEQQVRPLIPASPGSLVIVTSRRQLAGLAASDGAHVLNLDVLPEAEARQMLSARIGAARAAAEPAAIAEIARLCAGLPLALAVIAARAQTRPSFPLSAIASELRDATTRLDVLDADDPAGGVRAVFSWSYQQLSPGAARMFRLLGLHPGPDISAAAATSLAGTDLVQARQALAELTRAHLLTEHAPGRYAFHDLLRAYAAGQARAADSDTERHQAVSRTLDHYLHTAHRAAVLLNPTFEPIALRAVCPGVTPEHLSGYEQAKAWFSAEQRTLLTVSALAADTRFDAHAWQLARTLRDFLNRQGHWRELALVQHNAVAAATRLGDTKAQAVCLQTLAITCAALGEYDAARAHLGQSLVRYQEVGDGSGQATVHQYLGWMKEREGHYADALDHYEQALRLSQGAGHRAGQARMLNNLGWIHARLEHWEQAQALCRQALALARELGDRLLEANIWDSLGFAERHLGHHTPAAECYSRAVRLFRELGDRFGEGEALDGLGDVYDAAGDRRQAGDTWQRALEILDRLQRPEADQVRVKLQGLDDPVTSVQ